MTKGVFDRLAEAVADQVSRAWFFASCLLLVVIWAPSYAIFQDVDVWQLVINTATTIVTFLLLALLQNTSKRSDVAIQSKLNAIAAGLRDTMEHMAHTPCSVDGCDFAHDVERLENAVGLEREVGTKSDDA